jgi:hypothetical protein
VKLAITQHAGRFVRVVFPSGKQDELPSGKLAALLNALSLPPVPQLDPKFFDLPEAALVAHYSSIWTNDDASHLVRLVFSTGRVLTVRTIAQQAFMLPFSVRDSATGLNMQTFDPRLSRAISAILPDDYLEKNRLAGRHSLLDLEITRPEPVEQPAVNEHEARDPRSLEAIEQELWRILRREESPQEKAEAERTGKRSERLLKRISLRDVAELLRHGANPNIADEHGQTALMHAAFPPFERERFRMVAEAGADLEARRYDGYTGLHLACSGGEAVAAEEWVRVSADVHSRTSEGATPLMLAARWPDIVRLLLAAGAETNAADEDGHNALAYAILQQCCVGAERQLEAIQALLDAGIDVNQRDRNGITPLGHAQRALREAELEQEVCRAFNPDWEVPDRLPWDDRRLAEEVVNRVGAAGGFE